MVFHNGIQWELGIYKNLLIREERNIKPDEIK